MFFFRRRPQTVNEAIGALVQAQEDLQEVASDRFEDATEQRRQAAELTTKAEANEAEAERAKKVVAKLAEIVDPE